MGVGAAVRIFAFAALAGLASARAETAVTPDPPTEVEAEGVDPFFVYDDFAWRTFLALNWPSQAHGGPDRAARLADPGARVWERLAPREAFLASRSENPCGAPPGDKVVSSFTPYSEFNQTTFTPGEPDSPLVARNGTYVRYETRFGGFGAPPASAPWLAPVGAVAVKAAWRVLTGADNDAVRARFYVAHSWITDVAASRAAGRVVCTQADLALVGLHLVVRTPNSPQGVWATFEHVDNVPPVGIDNTREPDPRDEGFGFDFNDPRRPQNEVWPPQGWRAAAPVSADNPPSLDPAPSQVMRKHPLRSEIMSANRVFWAMPEVAGSVWRRYMLVAVQWPTVVAPRGPQNDGRYFPGLPPEPGGKASKYKVDEADDGRNAANSVMETYHQDAPATCMACHHAVSNARGSDFVGVLGAAPARN